jgi:hypothetical protein
MAWTNIDNALVSVGALPFATTIQALRDNPIAIANGDAGAPSIFVAISKGSVGAIGTHAMMVVDRVSGGADVLPGDTVAGSALQFVSASGGTIGGVASGTWRCMGAASRDAVSSSGRVTLFIRIS